MDCYCLIVDTMTADQSRDGLELIQSLGFNAVIVQPGTQLEHAFHSPVTALIIFADDLGSGIHDPLTRFFNASGCLPELVCILAENPTPYLLAEAYEFGVETIRPLHDAETAIRELCERSAQLFTIDSPESRIFAIANAIRAGEQSEIQVHLQEAQPLSTFDYRVCYQMGQAQEALGFFTLAMEAYQNALDLNSQFRLGQVSMAESKMVMGKTGDALQILLALTGSNMASGLLKAQLAIVQAELGNLEQATQLILEAQNLGGPKSKILEAQAQVMLAEGDIAKAFLLMDDMTEVGPFFAAKLNELGIKLSQAGKGKSALALYQKAHKIVRPELKYKISMNASLACRRLGRWDDALGYLERCQKEFGGPFPKLEKIRLSLRQAQEKERLETFKGREVS